MASLAVRRAIRAVPGEYHVLHVEGIPPLDWQTTSCNRVRKKEDNRYLACWGLKFMPPDVAVRLLGTP